jgi:hypothetical protein
VAVRREVLVGDAVAGAPAQAPLGEQPGHGGAPYRQVVGAQDDLGAQHRPQVGVLGRLLVEFR